MVMGVSGTAAIERLEREPPPVGGAGLPPDDGSLARRWWLRPPRLVWLATVCFGLLTAFWSAFTPMAEAPDEPAHLGLVYYVADTGRYPAYDGLQHTQGLFQVCVDYSTSAKWCRTSEEKAAKVRRRERPADEAPPKDERVHWDDPEFAALEPERFNQLAQHPPVYYQLLANALRVERFVVPGEQSVTTELAYLRLLNVLMLLPLPWLAWCAARRLGLDDGVASLAALLPLGVPQLTHIGGTLNNDNLFVVWVSAFMVPLVGIARGDRSKRTAALMGLLLGLALLTKGFAVVLPPLVGVAYWIGTRHDGENQAVGRRAWRAAPAAAVGLGVTFLVAGWWYLGNLVRTGHVMPSIEDRVRLSPEFRPEGFEPDVGEYLGSTLGRIVEGYWGSFGWRMVRLPLLLSLVASGLWIAAMVIAYRRRAIEREDVSGNGRRDEHERPVRRSVLTVLVAPTVLLAAFVIIRSAVIYWEIGRLAFQQGRYLFGGLTAVSVLVAIGLHRRFDRRSLPIVVGAVLFMQGFAVAWCLVGWWDADDVGPWGALHAVVAWNGWPDPIVISLLLTGLVAFVALPVGALRRPQEVPPASPRPRFDHASPT